MLKKQIIIGLFASLIAGTAHAVTLTGTFNVTAVNVTNLDKDESKATEANFDAALAGTLGMNANPSVYTQDTFTYTGALDFEVGKPQKASYSVEEWLNTGTPGGVAGLDAGLAGKQLSFPNIDAGTATTTFFMFTLLNKMSAADFTVIHDDGIAIYEGDTLLGGKVGPTTKTTSNVDGYGGSDPFRLLYVATNGNPSILNVDAEFGPGGGITPVPVPATLPLLLAGVGGLVALRRRKAAS